jgi:hypothetical protein
MESTFAIETPENISLILLSPNKKLVLLGIGNNLLRIYNSKTRKIKYKANF